MARVSQNTKYVKLNDGVSFSLVRTNPKLTTNTKLMYNGKKMYMESYASSELLNRTAYKNVSVKPNSLFNKDIASFLTGSGSWAYNVYQNFSDIAISDSYDNQFETFYWCGAESIWSSSYSEEIGFVAPLYLREKLPNYFVIFRLDTPSNYNLVIGEDGKPKDPSFDFKTDILDKAVLIKTFDLREGSVLGNYIHNYINQEQFEFDKSMYVNFSNAEVTYYGINKLNGILEKKTECFKDELLKTDRPILKSDEWFTEGFERNGLIFPYIINIEYLFDDNTFKHNGGESYDFARYIGVYCNNIEFGEFDNLEELKNYGYTEDNAIYYFEDIEKNLHRYSNTEEGGFKIDNRDVREFDENLITGFEEDRITGYAEPLDVYEGFINRAQYGFEILKPFEPGDWVGIEFTEYVGGNPVKHAECYFADDKNVVNIDAGANSEMRRGEYSNFRFSVGSNSNIYDIARSLVKCVNHNTKSKFEAKCIDNVVVFYAKQHGKEYNGSETGGAKMLIEASLIYNEKISLPISNHLEYVDGVEYPVENISDSDLVFPSSIFNEDGDDVGHVISSFGNYYKDYFFGACDVDIDLKTETYKNVFKIYIDEDVFFNVGRYLKTKNGNGRKIIANMPYINSNEEVNSEYKLIIIDNVLEDNKDDSGYDISVSSTYQVEIMDKFAPNHGVLSWFPIKDFDFDINYSSYGQYTAFADECKNLSKKITYESVDSDKVTTKETINDIKTSIRKIAKSPFRDDFGKNLDSEYEYYLEQFHPDLCLISKSTPYISKWGYFDEQKDSCENPYRLNVSKVFGVGNLSANIYLRKCDIGENTHSMPYYMSLGDIDHSKDYQYVESDDVYISHNDKNKVEQYTTFDDTSKDTSISECINYWINEFMNTNVDKFSEIFSGKKYGKRFDRKYSRLLGGDKYHNPSTLFRGVKFEAIRYYSGLEKKSSVYNDYKFSFVYIPMMINSINFESEVYFVKNDTFKFIVGIVFVNTMLGVYDHNIFNGEIDYFNKGFIYSACDNIIIRPPFSGNYGYELTFKMLDGEITNEGVDYTDFWKDKIDNLEGNTFYMWENKNDASNIIVTKNYSPKKNEIIGEFKAFNYDGENEPIGIKNIKKFEKEGVSIKPLNNDDKYSFELSYSEYYPEYDTLIYRYDEYDELGKLECKVSEGIFELKNNILINVCDVEWSYYDENNFGGYRLDVSELCFKSETIRKMLYNLGTTDSVVSVRFYNTDSTNPIDKTFKNGDGVNIIVDPEFGVINFYGDIIDRKDNILEATGSDGEDIENLMVDIKIKDILNFDSGSVESLALKDYFSVFNQISMSNIATNINDDYNVKYYSTVEDSKYKIRVVEPDSVEIEDIYEAIPVKVTKNNKNVIGSVEIVNKENPDKIGTKIINRYSGFYNPIFNDVLYFGDYTYNTNVGRLKNTIKYELPYSNTYIDYNYSDLYGEFGVIKNIYYHKTNTTRSNNILSFEKPVYPAINEYALGYRDYNIFSSSWDDGYFVSQDSLDSPSVCVGIGSMKDNLCMFGSKYLNLPDYIFIDTFEDGKLWDEKMVNNRDNTTSEIMYKEINGTSVKYHLFIERRLKRYLVEHLLEVFSKYINKKYSFGDTSTIVDDVEEYVEKNLLKLYKVDRVYLHIKEERMKTNNKRIENEYLKYVNVINEDKIKRGFPVISIGSGVMLKESVFSMRKSNEFDRDIIYNLKPGYKESFGFGVLFRRK